MNVQVKSSNGITLAPMDTRLLADRKVFVEVENQPGEGLPLYQADPSPVQGGQQQAH